MKRYPLLTFFALAYLISWSAALALHWIALRAGLANFGELMSMAETTFSLSSIASVLVVPAPLVFVLSRIVDFGPSFAGLLTPLLIGEADEARGILRRLFNLRAGVSTYAWALLLPLGMVLAAFGLHMTLGDSAVTGAAWNGLATIGLLLFWVFVMRTLLGGGLGEELGWRGFALPRLAEKHGAIRASLVIGLVWTFWHLPGWLTGASPLVNMAAQLLFTMPLSFVFTWFYFKTEQRLLPVVLMHGALNGFNAFFERSLFPPLADEDGFVLFFILVSLIAGVIAALRLRKGALQPDA